MDIYICSSSLSVTPIINMTGILQNDNAVSEYKIITTYQQGAQLMSHIYPSQSLICLDPFPNFNSTNPLILLHNGINSFITRQRLKKIFLNYRGCKVHFFSVAFAPLEFYLVKILSRKNSIIHHRIVSITPEAKKILSIKSIMYKIGYWIFYGGIPIEIKYAGGRYITALSESFLRKINAEQKIWDTDSSPDTTILLQKMGINVGNARILFAPHDLPSAGLINTQNYIRKSDALITAITDTFGIEKIAIKAHPVWNRLYGLENKIETKIPDYLTTELFIDKFSCIISGASAALITAAKSGKTAISLLDYFEIPEDKKNFFRKYLDKESGGKILYPSNLIDILRIISSSLSQQ